MAVNPIDFEIAAELASIQSELGQIEAYGAKEATSATILDAANDIIARLNTLLNYAIGITATLSALAVRVADTQETLLNAMGSPQQSTKPVILPTTPPAGYGGASVGDIWTSSLNSYTFAGQAGSYLRKAGWLASNYSYATAWLPWADHEPWLRSGSWDSTDFQNDTALEIQIPVVDYRTIRKTDANIQSWLTRVYPVTGLVSYTTIANGQVKAVGPSNNYALLPLTPAQFVQYQNGTINGVDGAPVWPGLANVTLGLPVTLTGSGVTVVGPMHGVIFNFSGVTPAKAFYDFQGKISWRYVGQVAFEDDNGDLEFPQSISFETSVVCPTTMAEASFCQVRLGTVTLTGTVTPWTRN